MDTIKKSPSLLLVVLAFAAVYLIWGSTYFFIEMAVKDISPMILGAIRFIIAGLILMGWVAIKGERIWDKRALKPAMISGLLMLFLGNGAVIWAEQFLPSSFVAIFLASAPLWFLLLDKVSWQQNFSNKFTLIGVAIGLLGVIALFYEKVMATGYQQSLVALIILCIANISWSMGSLFSKYKVKNTSVSVSSAWQMLAAGLAFIITGIFNGEVTEMEWAQIPAKAWMAVAYLIVFGSIIGYSAYVFLLSVRSATQVSTYAYVNPLVAVLLGVLINHDRLTAMQLGGLAVILCSVFFINLAKKSQLKMKARLKVLP
ncbi:EamA family transporter [Niabella ginsengisoli]|uniref:EamA family transporter n=1 Tax=Niabella ginsengisoli TaxID=522298 RepID=A0ABS9SLQ6_9BACT|nr:EamA family transporter [Niabella ginsengisoli]MCH5599318.1 EamA family transporter [Niabella ginsengisoli]